MRIAVSHLSLLLHSAVLAFIARTELASAHDTDSSVPAADSGAPAGPAPAPASPPPSTMPNVHVGARVRVAGRYYSINGGANGSAVDSTYGELRASGELHEGVTFTLSLYAFGVSGPIGVEDAFIGFDFAEPVHLWVGQMLVPADRANLGGPFSAIPWNFYPGLLACGGTTRLVALPRGNLIGRDGGGLLWGDLAEEKLHYALGGFLPGATPPSTQAQTMLLSGRLSGDLLGKLTGADRQRGPSQ
jgi:hypothetical protein